MNRNESTAEIAAGLVEQAEKLVRLEVALAKQEVKELAITNAWAIGAFAGAGLLAVLAIFVGLPVLAIAVAPIHWLAAVIWIVLYLAIAAGLALFGRTKLKIGIPELTVTSLKETRNWAIRQIRSPGR